MRGYKEFNKSGAEFGKKTVSRLKLGSTQITTMDFERALESLNNFYKKDQKIALEQSSDENPIKAGSFYYWLNK